MSALATTRHARPPNRLAKTTKHDVIATHKAHPDWTCCRIAGHLGCMVAYVSATMRRNGLKLPNSDKRSRTALSKANPHLPSGAAACAADTAGATLLPAPADQFESDGPKSRPGDAASLTQQSSSPRQERPSAQERSSDRSGGQFGDAPKPAHIPGTEVQP